MLFISLIKGPIDKYSVVVVTASIVLTIIVILIISIVVTVIVLLKKHNEKQRFTLHSGISHVHSIIHSSLDLFIIEDAVTQLPTAQPHM